MKQKLIHHPIPHFSLAPKRRRRKEERTPESIITGRFQFFENEKIALRVQNFTVRESFSGDKKLCGQTCLFVCLVSSSFFVKVLVFFFFFFERVGKVVDDEKWGRDVDLEVVGCFFGVGGCTR